MEDSIRRAEKLVHATNSALAQMKYDLSFEDYKKESRALKVPDKKTKSLFLDEELQRYEEEFKSEANEMLLKMDKMLDPNQYLLSRKPSSQAIKIRERMREINYKLQDRRQEQANFFETEQSRLKLLSLMNQEKIKTPPKSSLKQLSSSNNSETYKNTSSTVITAGTQKNLVLRKTDSLPALTGNSVSKLKSKEELKNKLLETQEIVDRGFETARHLKQKVESLKNFEKKIEKTPSTVKTCFSENLNTIKSFDSTRKSESNETVKLKKTHRCKKHQEKEKKKEKYLEDKRKSFKEMMNYEEKEVVKNNSFISIKRAEGKKLKDFKFSIQTLPSLHIKNGLQVQRVHNLDILPENLKIETNIDNVGIKVISHEDMEREKINKIVENIENENFKKIGTNHIECFNCGKLNKVEENFVDPSEIDNLLMKCSFNVFDPRIDEFVEKYRQTKTISNFAPEMKTSEIEIKEPLMKKANENKFFEKETKEKSTQKNIEIEKLSEELTEVYKDEEFFPTEMKIKELSEEITQAYKEKAYQLEDDYEEFESILRSLFRKIDKSRQVFDKFDSCHIFSSIDDKEKNLADKTIKYTKTEPVIICLPGSSNEQNDADGEKSNKKDSNSVHKQYHRKHIFRKKEKKKGLSKKNVKHDIKRQVPENPFKKKVRKEFILENKIVKNQPKENVKENKKIELKFDQIVSPVLSVPSEISDISKTSKKNIIEIPTKYLDNQCEFSENSCTESILDEKLNSPNLTENEDMKTENDYDSDFEIESIKKDENKNLESDKVEEENENEDLIKCMKKLSTIIEVDSEAEKKISEIEFTNSSKQKSIKIAEDLELLHSCSSYKKSKNRTSSSLPKFEKNSTSSSDLNKSADIFEIRAEKEDFSNLSPSFKSNHESIISDKCKNLDIDQKSNCLLENFSQKLSDIPLNFSPKKNNSSSPVVSALKEVLSALQDQVHKTQYLAEKLTENAKSRGKQTNTSEIESLKSDSEILSIASPVIRDKNFSGKELLSNLQNNRRNLDNVSNQQNGSLFLNLTDEENQNSQFLKLCEKSELPEAEIKDNLIYKNTSKSPLLENIRLDYLNSVSIKLTKEERASESSSSSDISLLKLALSSSRKEKSSKLNSAKSEAVKKEKIVSPLSMELDSENSSYSEGEIVNPDILENEKSSTQSIGEVISERISKASSSE